MDLKELKSGLENAHSHEQRVEEIAQFFGSHSLVFGHGTDSAGGEAYWLVRHLQHWNADHWTSPPTHDHIDEILEIAHLRVTERRPLAYLLGRTWFAGLEFNIDRRALIPRSPMAEIIERGFAPWISVGKGNRVLDIGTGSGCLAVSAAHHCPGILVEATDVSPDALELAEENVKKHGFEDYISLIQSDLFDAVCEKYDVIISNPPYVPRARLASLPAEYIEEPAVALDGGSSGLNVVNRILRDADGFLRPGGVLFMEVGEIAQAFSRAHPKLPLTWLEFERGGEGVFMLTREELTGYFRG